MSYTHICVGDLVKEHECHEGTDKDFDSFILDDDKLLDVMVRYSNIYEVK